MENQTQLHDVLPKGLSVEELANWLRNNAVEKFTDIQKKYFTPEEIQDFEHESSMNGREMNRLNAIKKIVTDLVTKGTEEEQTIKIPATKGTKLLDTFRRQNDDVIESGFESTEVEVFAIPYIDGRSMEFFDIEGNHIADRSRPMSAKERHTHIGMFDMEARMSVHKGEIVDEDSGEVLGKAI